MEIARCRQAGRFTGLAHRLRAITGASGYNIYEWAADHWFGQHLFLRENDTVTDLADGFLGRGDRRRLPARPGKALAQSPVPNLTVVSDVVEGLDASARSRIEALQGEGRFVWIDASSGETGPDDLRDGLGIPEGAVRALLAFGDRGPRARKVFVGEGVVVFPSTCYLESSGTKTDTLERLRAVEVHLLVARDYVLTVHKDAFSLPTRLAPYLLEERGGRHTVFEVAQAMVATSFDALYEVELALDRLAERSTTLSAGRVRMGTLRAISSRLSRMRRGVAPQRGLFERIGLELGRIEDREGDEERYFNLLGGQVNHLVEGIDASADALATVIDLRLNATIYLLTVVATIFLPLTFVTGFFGMNFKWLTDGIDTPLAFWLLGIGLLVVGVALILGLIVRGSPLEVEPEGRPRRRGRRSRR